MVEAPQKCAKVPKMPYALCLDNSCVSPVLGEFFIVHHQEHLREWERISVQIR